MSSTYKEYKRFKDWFEIYKNIFERDPDQLKIKINSCGKIIYLNKKYYCRVNCEGITGKDSEQLINYSSIDEVDRVLGDLIEKNLRDTKNYQSFSEYVSSHPFVPQIPGRPGSYKEFENWLEKVGDIGGHLYDYQGILSYDGSDGPDILPDGLYYSYRTEQGTMQYDLIARYDDPDAMNTALMSYYEDLERDLKKPCITYSEFLN